MRMDELEEEGNETWETVEEWPLEQGETEETHMVQDSERVDGGAWPRCALDAF